MGKRYNFANPCNCNLLQGAVDFRDQVGAAY